MHLMSKQLACVGMMAALTCLTGCHDPIAGSWVCTLYVNGAAVANASDEVFVFSRNGDYSWTTAQGGLERRYLGTYVSDARPSPNHIDASLSSYVENGVETDMADVTSLGIYTFEGFGQARQLYLNIAGGAVRPAAETLDKQVGPVWIGRRQEDDTPDLMGKALTLLQDTIGIPFLSLFE